VSLNSCRVLAVIDKNLDAAKNLAQRRGTRHALVDVGETRRLAETSAVCVAT
jgi:hypothetical protein